MDDIIFWILIGGIVGALAISLYFKVKGKDAAAWTALELAFYTVLLLLCGLGLSFFSERSAAQSKKCIESGGQPTFTIQHTYADCASPPTKSK